MNRKEQILSYLRNIRGIKTKRKIVAFAVDDYGNVRLHSQAAKEVLRENGLVSEDHFDNFDALETNEDLYRLFDVLTSVKDRNNNHAVFTPYANVANIDFESTLASKEFRYMDLDKTYKSLGAEYNNVSTLWNQGIESKIFVPQFHGRQHVNLHYFNEMLESGDKDLYICLRNKSYSGLKKRFPNINYQEEFSFENVEEIEGHKTEIKDGLNIFEKLFGYRAKVFNAPGVTHYSGLNDALFENGIKYLDGTFTRREHLGKGKYKTEICYSGKKIAPSLAYINRNARFEPIKNPGFDWVNYTLRQVEIAIAMNKPAIISSHRVNFSGRIEASNRDEGLKQLELLLNSLVKKWPDIEFFDVGEICKQLMPTHSS